MKYPDPILKKMGEPVGNIDSELNRLIDDMIETMYEADGVGLAAQQVGYSIMLAVMDVPMGDDYKRGDNLMALINPEIIDHEGEITYEEGCLSVPDYTARVARWERVSVKALNRSGEEIVINGEDLLSIALQHEIDHINGILIINRISRLKREIFERKLKKVSAG